MLKGPKAIRGTEVSPAYLFNFAPTIVRIMKSWSAPIVLHAQEILFKCSRPEIEGRVA